MTTIAAQAAAAIRKELKAIFPGSKFRVTSKNYSGGNSVRIEHISGPVDSAIESLASKYKMGSFNGMTDCYEYSNSNEDLPQVKFVFVS